MNLNRIGSNNPQLAPSMPESSSKLWGEGGTSVPSQGVSPKGKCPLAGAAPLSPTQVCLARGREGRVRSLLPLVRVPLHPTGPIRL